MPTLSSHHGGTIIRFSRAISRSADRAFRSYLSRRIDRAATPDPGALVVPTLANHLSLGIIAAAPAARRITVIVAGAWIKLSGTIINISRAISRGGLVSGSRSVGAAGIGAFGLYVNNLAIGIALSGHAYLLSFFVKTVDEIVEAILPDTVERAFLAPLDQVHGEHQERRLQQGQ